MYYWDLKSLRNSSDDNSFKELVDKLREDKKKEERQKFTEAFVDGVRSGYIKTEQALTFERTILDSGICMPESNQSTESILTFEHIEDARVSAEKKRYDEEILRAFEDGNFYLFACLCVEKAMLYGVD